MHEGKLESDRFAFPLSLSKVSEQEYYAKRCGQINLDLTNLELLGDGFTPAKTTFETEKEKIRNAITDIAEVTPKS